MEPRGRNGRLNTAVAEVLSTAREEAGVSTRRLAQLTGIDHRTMMRYLYDERAIDMDRLFRFATALGMTPHDVLERAQRLIDEG